MRDYRDAKAMAATLRQALKDQSIAISHSNAIELIAKSFGYRNWQVLEAKIAADATAPKPAEAAADPGAARPVLSCSFCGRTQYEVGKLIAGPTVFICDDCVGLCDDVIVDQGGQDPARYIQAQAGLGAKSPEELAILKAKAARRIAYARQILEAADRIERSAAEGEPPDPQRRFIEGQSATGRAAYLAAVRDRLAGLEQVAETVERLLSPGG